MSHQIASKKINNYSIYKAQNLVRRNYSKHVHAHTHTHTHAHAHTEAPAHTSMILTRQNLCTTQKWAANSFEMDEETDEDRSMKWKTWQGYSFGKRAVLRFDLKESREGFCRRGRGRSFHVEGLKTEKTQEPTVEGLVRGIWRLGVSEVEQRVRDGV